MKGLLFFSFLALLCTRAHAVDEWPKTADECVPISVFQIRSDAQEGQWRYYRDPHDETRCMLLSYQQPWDRSKPTSLQIIPSSLPEPVLPYLTQHGLLRTTLPSRHDLHINWLHLGYAEDRVQYRRYMAILSQPALADRVNEVMAWQNLAQAWPLDSSLSDAERLAHVDLTVALLLSQEPQGHEVSEILKQVHLSQEKMQFYHYLMAISALRESESREYFGKTTKTPTQDYYLPVRSAAVYKRILATLGDTLPPTTYTLHDAAKAAEQLLLAR